MRIGPWTFGVSKNRGAAVRRGGWHVCFCEFVGDASWSFSSTDKSRETKKVKERRGKEEKKSRSREKGKVKMECFSPSGRKETDGIKAKLAASGDLEFC